MRFTDLLLDAFGRSHEGGLAAIDGLTVDQLAHRPGPEANPIGWLVWHFARVQDDHVAGASGLEQVWTSQGFFDRFGLPYPVEDFGFGHTSEQVAAFNAEAGLIGEYLDAVHAQTVGWLPNLSTGDLDRVVDTRWDPPVTLGVRLVSVIDECAQHVGQAAYLRGLLKA